LTWPNQKTQPEWFANNKPSQAKLLVLPVVIHQVVRINPASFTRISNPKPKARDNLAQA